MSDDEKEGGDELDSEVPGGSKKKKLIIIIVAVLLLIGAGAGAYFSGLFGGSDSSSEEAEVAEHGDGAEAGDGHGEEAASGDAHGDEVASGDEHAEGSGAAHVNEGPIYYSLPDFLVNLNTGGKGVSFLKAKIVLEVANQKVAEKLRAVEPRIVDGFNTYLLELRSSDLVGSAGLYRLREEMMLRVNKAIYPDKVDDILFKEIIVQ
jgi:flagellar FliL protein